MSVRLALAEAGVLLVLALAAASATRTLPDTWTFLSRVRATYSDRPQSERNLVPEFQTLLPAPVTSFFAARVRRGERFYVQVRGGPFVAGVDYPTAVRTLARYELLPGVEVADPQQADVVFSIEADPRTLGLRYERVERAPAAGYFVARVRK